MRKTSSRRSRYILKFRELARDCYLQVKNLRAVQHGCWNVANIHHKSPSVPTYLLTRKNQRSSCNGGVYCTTPRGAGLASKTTAVETPNSCLEIQPLLFNFHQAATVTSHKISESHNGSSFFHPTPFLVVSSNQCSVADLSDLWNVHFEGQVDCLSNIYICYVWRRRKVNLEDIV